LLASGWLRDRAVSLHEAQFKRFIEHSANVDFDLEIASNVY
jgi:hypothetical protein